MRAFLIAMALALAGCIAQHPSMYTRTDNRSVDAAQEQATLAQCKGEGASATQVNRGGPYGVVERERKEAAIVNACMARNVYVQAQQ